MGKLLSHYRPELYYMRGPGPKWLEKHAPKEAPLARSKAAELLRLVVEALRRATAPKRALNRR